MSIEKHRAYLKTVKWRDAVYYSAIEILGEYDALKVQHEATLDALQATAKDAIRFQDALMEAPRENEAETQVRALREALDQLYTETADYITINRLGDVHHNRSMQMARDALAIPPTPKRES